MPAANAAASLPTAPVASTALRAALAAATAAITATALAAACACRLPRLHAPEKVSNERWAPLLCFVKPDKFRTNLFKPNKLPKLVRNSGRRLLLPEY